MYLTDAQYADWVARSSAILGASEAMQTKANTTVNTVIATWNARFASMTVTSYIDPVNGLDTNAGTQASPFKTIQKAIDVTPMGGIAWVCLLSPLTLTSDVLIHNRWVMVSGIGARHVVQFDRYSAVIGGTTYRKIYNFKTRGNAALTLQNLTVKMPVLEAPWSGYGTDGTCFIAGPDFGWFGNHTINFAYCDIQRPANCFAPLCPGHPGAMPINLGIYGLTATDQPLAGWYCDQIAAGTAVASLSWLNCNYSTI